MRNAWSWRNDVIHLYENDCSVGKKTNKKELITDSFDTKVLTSARGKDITVNIISQLVPLLQQTRGCILYESENPHHELPNTTYSSQM